MCKRGIKEGNVLTRRQNPLNRVEYGYERNLCMNCRQSGCMKGVDTHMVRHIGDLAVPVVRSILPCLRQKAGTYAQRETNLQNGVTVAGVLHEQKEFVKQVTNRKPYNGGIIQDANACGNAQDMLTWTLQYG